MRLAEGAAHGAEQQLAESRAAQVNAAEKAETLAARLQRVERAAEEARQEAARREARDAARVEELEREKGSLTRAKQVPPAPRLARAPRPRPRRFPWAADWCVRRVVRTACIAASMSCQIVSTGCPVLNRLGRATT